MTESSEFVRPASTPFKVSAMGLFGEKDGSMRLDWAHQPKSVMIVEKIRDPRARSFLIAALQYLFQVRHLSIITESYVVDELSEFSFLQSFESEDLTNVDFVLVFGGDGTLLHVSQLFPSRCPPIVPFAMGSLGFLTPFLCDDYQTVIDDVVRGFFYVTSRTRLLCEIRRVDSTVEHYQALNDLVLTSGTPGSVCAIECSIDGEYFTTVYGDGLIIATATRARI
jgi:NAD kinase